MLPTFVFLLLLVPCAVWTSILPAAFNECRVGQINTYNASQHLINRIQTSHNTFMRKWWNYRCEIEPWIGCRVPCQVQEKHLQDPFTFCFSDLKVPAPVDSGVLKTKHMVTKDFLQCNTYFVNGTMQQSVYANDRVYGMTTDTKGWW